MSAPIRKSNLGPPGPTAPDPLILRANLSVTTREHLCQRFLPLFPAFTTLKYSGYETHVDETHGVPALAAPIGAQRI
jgi:hypothetical protein